ncbi:MAG: hypothetical protein ACM3KD_01075 [Hyphomicrobiaceae bacterium]
MYEVLFMPTDSGFPSASSREKGALGIFQLLGLGLLLMVVLFVVIVVVRSLFGAA